MQWGSEWRSYESGGEAMCGLGLHIAHTAHLAPGHLVMEAPVSELWTRLTLLTHGHRSWTPR